MRAMSDLVATSPSRALAEAGEDERPRASWLVSWVPLLLVATLPLLAVRRLFRPISDPDTFWHVRAGQYLWDTWRFSGPDTWSTFSSRPFVLHEWLAELGIAWSYHLGGFLALSWLQAALAVGALLVLYAGSRRLGAQTLPAAALSVAGWVGTMGGLALRPQVVSFMLLAVTVVIWLRTAEDCRARWWLIPMTWLWACVHGLWIAGPITGIAVLAGLLLDRRLTRREGLRLGAVLGGSVLAAGLTPVGPHLLLLPFSMRGYAGYVMEWSPTKATDPFALVTLALAIGILAVWARRGTVVSWVHVGLWTLGLAWTLTYARTLALGAITFTLLGAVTARHLLPDLHRGIPHRVERAVIASGLLATVAVCIAFGSSWAGSPGRMSPALESRVTALPAKTVVFNDYGLGGWILFANHGVDPVIDGRADVYTVAHFGRYLAALNAEQGWQATLRDSGASVALLEKRGALATGLREQLGWRVVAEDPTYALLRAPVR